jgi:hypothetical protein
LQFARDLKEAGLFQFYLHVDRNQERPGWTGKSEYQMNALRQHFADLLHKAGVWCGFNVTIRHSNFEEVKDILGWYRSNISRVSHLSLIAFRGIQSYDGYELFADGNRVDPQLFSNNLKNEAEINISTLDIYHDIYHKLLQTYPGLYPCSYLNGTSDMNTFKMLIINSIGSDKKIYGDMGGKTIEIYQFLKHLVTGKYEATVPSPGKSIFLLSFFDKRIRKALANYLTEIARNPMRLFDGIYVQSLVLQQPFEFIDHEANLCDGCVNLMPYQGKMINSCRLDEYRLAGGPLSFRKIQKPMN